MTRARRRPYLSWAVRYEGAKTWQPSRFLGELRGGGENLAERTQPGTAAAAATPGPLDRHRERFPGRRRGRAPVSLSFSAAAVYRECPRQYWFRHVLRLPPAATVEAQFGTVLHLALMRAGRLRQEAGEVSWERLTALHAEAWNESPLVDPRRRPVLESLGERFLRSFWEAGGLARRPHLVEQPFTATVDGWTLRGIIDRVDPPPTQEGGVVGFDGGPPTAWRLVDYKTGGAAPASRLRRDLQLALYALGAQTALGLRPLELEIVYLRDAKRVLLPATPELLDEARRAGGEVAAGVREGRFEPRPERRRCRLCSYRLACEAAL